MNKFSPRVIKKSLIIYLIVFFSYIGISVIIDYLFERAITTEMITSTLWKAPFMAVVLTFIYSMRNVIAEEVKN